MNTPLIAAPVRQSPLLDVHEAADYLRVSERTLWRLSRVDGLVPFVRVSKVRCMYRKADLDAYIERQLQTAAV